MQVERGGDIKRASARRPPPSGGRVSNAWTTCRLLGDNRGKPLLIPHKPSVGHPMEGKGLSGRRWVRVRLASWRGSGPPKRRSVAGLRGRTATLGLRYGPDSYGRQQWGILHNGGNPDAATPRGRGSASAREALSAGGKQTVPAEEAPAKYVPAAAVIRMVQALSGFTGCKGSADGGASRM